MTTAESTPRSVRQLVVGAFELYRRYPLLFVVLAAGVIVPYEVIVLLATGVGAFGQSTLSLEVALLLFLIEWVLISPLVSALHVHAVAEAREGRDPRLAPIARRGLRVLPVVVAASIISGLGIGLGLLALVIPGVLLMLRWYVVAQAAAIENEGWLPALRRSGQLTAGHYGHVFVFAIYVGLIVSVPSLLVGAGFDPHTTTVASFLVGLIVQVFALSFAALASAVLYYDLRTRRESALARGLTGVSGAHGEGPPASNHSLDPRKYSDDDRPKGWYVDPGSPSQMRYWGVGDPPGWGGTTRTPRKTRRVWQAENE